VTVSGFVCTVSPDVPLSSTAVGSEWGASAAAVTVSVAWVSPSTRVAGVKVPVAPAGRPTGASVIAPVNPGSRVTVTSTVAFAPVRTGSLVATTERVNEAAGGGVPASGSPGSAAPPPPHPRASPASSRAASREKYRSEATAGVFMAAYLLVWMVRAKK
jgi:hypothetical protein